jgi:hypothetical protein
MNHEHGQDGYRSQAVDEWKARMPRRRGDGVGNGGALCASEPGKAGIVRLRRRVGYLHERIVERPVVKPCTGC